MPAYALPQDYPRIKKVSSFEELMGTPLVDGVNALCWQRELQGDFEEVARQLPAGEGVVPLEEEQLLALSLSAAGRLAAVEMIEDLRRLRSMGLSPELNHIFSYPRDEPHASLPTDVHSFHADSAPVEADTCLCTYHGPASEGLRNDEAVRRVDILEKRAELLRLHGGEDDDRFRVFLEESCQDLHYSPLPQARPFGFGLGNLWRIAVAWPGCPVPPCVHRAPVPCPGQTRLLLIS